MKGNKLHKGISTAAGFLFVIGVILCVICALCMSRGFFKYEYEKNGTAAYLDISDSDLERATEHWLAYIEDSEDDLDISVTLSGEERQLFNDREKEHMVDVKNLYLGALTVGRICAALAVIILLLEIFVFKRLRQAVSGYIRKCGVFRRVCRFSRSGGERFYDILDKFPSCVLFQRFMAAESGDGHDD